MLTGRFFWLDQSRHLLQISDLASNEILSELSYPADLEFIQSQLSPDQAKIYLLSSKDCYVYDWPLNKLEKLGLNLEPLQIAVAPSQPFLFLADTKGSIVSFHLLTGTLYPFGQAQCPCDCVALVASTQEVYALFEHDLGGTLLIFNYAGQILQEFSFPGTPTNLAVRPDGLLSISFTNNAFTGEGVIICQARNPKENCEIYHLRNYQDPLPCYPSSVAFDHSREKAYVAIEDSASLGIIHLKEKRLETLCIGQSISTLQLVSESLALAVSERFAEVLEINLTTGKVSPIPAATPGHSGATFLYWNYSPS